MSQMIQKGPESDYARGEFITADTLRNTGCSEEKINFEVRSSGSNEHTKEKKIAEGALRDLSVLFLIIALLFH